MFAFFDEHTINELTNDWGGWTITRKRALSIGFGIFVTVACLALVIQRIPLADAKESFSRANYFTLPLLMLALFLFFWLKAVRWRLLLQPLQRFRTREVVPAMMIGFMGNNILPAHLGEFARVFVLGRQYKLSKTAVFSSVVLERIFDVVAILMFLGIGVAFAPGLPDEQKTASLYLAGITGVAVFILAVYLFWTDHFVRMAEWMLSFWFVPGKLRTLAVTMLESGAEGLHSMRSGKLVAGIFLTSVLQWFINGIAIYASMWSFGIRISPLAAFVVMGVVAIGVTIPSTPGFFGLVQICFMVSLAVFGVKESDAVAASIYYHLCQYIPVTLVGFYYLNRTGMRLGEFDKQAAQETEPEKV